MRVVFAGTPEFAVPCLQALLDSKEVVVAAVYTQPDRPAGRGKKLQPSPVKLLAEKYDVPVCQPQSFKEQEDIQKLREIKPDLMVVTAYGLLLPQAVLDIPPLGCVNLHASLLPRWRGAAPIQRAIEAGDQRTGVTLMQIVRQLDAGPMLAKCEIKIESTETSASLHDKLSAISGELLSENLQNLRESKLVSVDQNSSEVTHAAKLSKAESVMDWQLPALELERKARALFPWPIATFDFAETRLRVISCCSQVDVKEFSTAHPGEVVLSDENGILVSTGEGLLQLNQIQKPGGKPLSIKDFINGMPIPVGTILT